MFNIFKLGGRPKPQPQQEFLTHDGMSLFYEQTISQIKQAISKIQSHVSSTASTPRPSTASNNQSSQQSQQQTESDIERLKRICDEVLSHMKRISDSETTKEKKAEKIEKDMKERINYYFDPLHHALHDDLTTGASHSQQQLLLVTIHGMQEHVVDCVQVSSSRNCCFFSLLWIM